MTVSAERYQDRKANAHGQTRPWLEPDSVDTTSAPILAPKIIRPSFGRGNHSHDN